LELNYWIQAFQGPTGAELLDQGFSGSYWSSTTGSGLSRVLLELNYWIQAFLFKLVPCILLTVLTVMLIFVMHQANRRRMKLKSQVFYRPCNRFTSIKDYYYF